MLRDNWDALGDHQKPRAGAFFKAEALSSKDYRRALVWIWPSCTATGSG